MITMAQPSLALHAADVPGYRYKMWATWEVPKTAPVATVPEWIAYAVDRSPEMALKNVVLNSHGSPGRIYFGHGGKGIGEEDLDPFKILRARSIGCIWIVACEVGSGNGPVFCKALAKTTGTFVVAADALQSVSFGYEVYARLPFVPYGSIDDYEGRVTRYGPDGSAKIIGQSAQGLWD